MIDQIFLSLFTPSRSRPEDLEAILVQRHGMLADAVERVKESATTGNKHHLLFVGPRGTGKTHLVTLLVHRLDQDASLNNTLRIAWLNEDDTSTTLLEFLQRIYLSLNKHHEDEFDKKSFNVIFNFQPEEAKRYIIQLLLEKLQKYTLLVIVESIDTLFEGLGKSGQQDLRAFIQENPVFSFVATAQKITDDISKRKNTFFGFFQTEQLKNLSIDEATELLSKIAIINNQQDVASFLQSDTGRSRILALYHISGGNHRIYMALSKFITHDSINMLVDLFAKMMDKMTPYYQERIRWLAPQQRKIIEYLCTCERPVPVKEIAKRLFATHQSISSQLNDLRKNDYVQANQRGRESLYEIADPLMRICVVVKGNQTNESLRILINFLRIWHDEQELFTQLKGCNSKGITDGTLDNVESSTADYSATIDLKGTPIDDVARALFNRGIMHWIQNNLKKSEKDFKAVISLKNILMPLRVDAYLFLVEIYMNDGRWDSAILMIDNGLREGNSRDIYSGDSTNIIAIFFKSTFIPKIRQERIRMLVKVYEDNNAIAQLSGALIKHLGVLFTSGEDLPASDNLELWASAWEDTFNNIDESKLPLRIFRTGIDFLKSNGKDLSILLDLNQEEVKILKQAMAL